MRLIDADALIAEYCEDCEAYLHKVCDRDVCGTVLMLAEAPTIDAVPVVRCEDCKHFHKSIAFSRGGVWCEHHGIDIDADDFCSYGERRSE